jgi:hypothetical protein
VENEQVNDAPAPATPEAAGGKKKKGIGVNFKVSAKGAVSVYGLGRFPVTLYREQWLRLLEKVDDLKVFLDEHADELKAKGEALAAAAAAEAAATAEAAAAPEGEAAAVEVTSSETTTPSGGAEGGEAQTMPEAARESSVEAPAAPEASAPEASAPAAEAEGASEARAATETRNSE